jgi:hypothetical protein
VPRLRETSSAGSRDRLELAGPALRPFFAFVNSAPTWDEADDVRRELRDILERLHDRAISHKPVFEVGSSKWPAYDTIDIFGTGGRHVRSKAVNDSLRSAVDAVLNFFFTWTLYQPHARLDRCSHCGSWYIQKRLNQTYCSLACRRAQHADAKRSTRKSKVPDK